MVSEIQGEISFPIKMQRDRQVFNATPTASKTPSKLRHELLSPFQDSPSKNTRSRARTVTAESDVEKDDDENSLQVVKRRPDFVIKDWLNDIPYMYKLVEILSVIISIFAVIFWGVYKLVSNIPVPTIPKNKLSKILRTGLLVFLLGSSFYLLKTNRVPVSVEQVTTDSQPVNDFDSLWVLVQNQINPLVKKLSTYSSKLEKLEQLTKQGSLSDSGDIAKQFYVFRNEMEQKIQATIIGFESTVSKVEKVKQTAIEETRELAINEIRKFAKNFLPIDLNVDNLDIEEINENLKQIMSNLVNSDDRGAALMFHKYGPDYALYSAGSTIDTKLTTETFKGRNQEISKLLRLPTGPESILDQNLDPGHCWAMKGFYF